MTHAGPPPDNYGSAYHEQVQAPVQESADELAQRYAEEDRARVARQQEDAARAQQGTQQY